jgi:hypothetical protein
MIQKNPKANVNSLDDVLHRMSSYVKGGDGKNLFIHRKQVGMGSYIFRILVVYL